MTVLQLTLLLLKEPYDKEVYIAKTSSGDMFAPENLVELTGVGDFEGKVILNSMYLN